MLPEAILLLTVCGPQASASKELADAQKLQAEGRLVETRAAFEAYLDHVPGDPVAHEGLSIVTEQIALAERNEGHADAALQTLLRGERDLPDDQRILYDLGVLEDELQLDLDAASTLEHLLTIKPVDASAYYAMGRVDLALGKLAEAEAAMKAYLESHPEDASAHYGLGRVYLQGLQFELARQEFERSIALQPKQSEAYYELGETNLDQDRFSEAIASFGKALERDARHGGALAGIGTAYFKQKQYGEAEKWLRRAVAAAPEYQPGHYYLGLTLARLRKQEESHLELDAATTLAAKDSKQAAQRVRIYEPETRP